MLLRFSFANWASFRDEAELSLVASSLKGDAGAVRPALERGGASALSGCLIYGANASGKSNVIAALSNFRSTVRFSHSRGKPDGGIPRKPFQLDPVCKSKPTTFEVEFAIEGVLYEFGYIFNDEEIIEEWLYAHPGRGRQVWYKRDRQDIKFGKYLKGNTSQLAALARKNSLFLSAAIQNNYEPLVPVFKFIDSIEFLRSGPRGIGLGLAEKPVLDSVVEFLHEADFGIVEVKSERRKTTEFTQGLLGVVAEFVSSHDAEFDKSSFLDADQNMLKDVSFGHRSEDGDVVYLDISDESDGTIKLAEMLVPVLEALKKGTVLVIDELDANLHPLLSSKIFAMFSDPRLNKNGAQIIATTHDTMLLTSTNVRRDQVWFTEKSKAGVSNLYPLSDFTVRGSDNIEKGYIDGRFGGVPFLGDVKKLTKRLVEETELSD
jgi:AAA15 family ATPase/GTPase